MRRSSALVIAVAILSALVVAIAADPAGAQPDNDDFADAIELVGEPTAVGSSVAVGTGTNVDATDEEDEPFPPVANRGSVWWSWVAPSSVGSLTVSTAGSSFDTVVSVWTGESFDDLELIGWSDDIDFLGDVLTSEVTVSVERGVRYHVAVSGYDYASQGERSPRSGDVAISLTWNPVEYVSTVVEPASPPAVSGDGRFVAFATSEALVDVDTNELVDVYRLDTTTGTPVLVSVGAQGAAQGSSDSPAISADGSIVAFASSAPDLVAGDDNDQTDVFVRDLDAGATRLVSRSINDGPGSGGSLGPSLSADGNRVAFESFASDLVRDDANASSDVFVHDLEQGTTELVSADVDGGSAEVDSRNAAIAAGGGHVVFESAATDLSTDDGDATVDVFHRDLTTGTTTRIPSGGGDEPGWISGDATVSADGQVVVSESRPTEEANAQIILHDVAAGTDTIIWADGEDPTVSDDGRIVALSGRDRDGAPSGVIVFDVVLGQTVELRDVARGDDVPTGRVALAGDGRTLAVVDRRDAETGRLAIAERGVPAAVTGLDAVAGDRSIELTWEPTGTDEVEVLVEAIGDDAPVSEPDVVVDGDSATVSGLVNGVPHRVEVRALTAAGAGPADVVTALPSTTPGAVVLTGVDSDADEIVLTWQPPADGGQAITDYEITVEPEVGIPTRDGERLVIGDLAAGTELTVSIRAVNPNGPGPATTTQRLVAAPGQSGYFLVTADGTVFAFGGAAEDRDLDPSASPLVAAAAVPGTDGILGLYADAVVRADGVVPTLATPQRFELLPGESVVDLLVADPNRGWVITSTGRVLTLGRAASFGDPSGEALVAPIVGADLTPDGDGYYLLAADGGVFAYGSATFEGSVDPAGLAGEIIDLVADPDGEGYWVFAADGGVFALEAPFAGSAVDSGLVSPIVGAVGFDGAYVLLAEDGGVFNFSDGPFLGGLGAEDTAPIVAIAAVDER